MQVRDRRYVQASEILCLYSSGVVPINMEMFNRRTFVRLLAFAFICLIGSAALHLAEHYHEHGAEDSQCPICHSGLAEAVPAFEIVIAAANVQSSETVVARFFHPSNLILANSSLRRAPPAAA